MEPTVSQKVQMLINLCASACPASKDVVLVEDASLLSDGVGSYSFKIGRFWSSIKNNFVEGGGKAHVRLSEVDKQAAVDRLSWLSDCVAER